MEKQSAAKFRRRALTKSEMMAIIEDWSDDETEIAAVTIIPPDKVDENTDEEDFDDNVIPIHEVSVYKSKVIQQTFVFYLG